jgi:hypothetical protein
MPPLTAETPTRRREATRPDGVQCVQQVPAMASGLAGLVACWRLHRALGWPLQGFAMVVGTGLLLFSLFLVG